MFINIKQGEPAHLEDCYEALMKSDIGSTYFSKFDARMILKDGLANGEIDVALDTENRCLGFIWCERHGAFGKHAYLHIIAVKEEYRGQSIGKSLISNMEENVFRNDDMIFLMVADFNQDAEKLYQSLGYTNVGTLPGFYKKGVDEHLMMKIKH